MSEWAWVEREEKSLKKFEVIKKFQAIKDPVTQDVVSVAPQPWLAHPPARKEIKFPDIYVLLRFDVFSFLGNYFPPVPVSCTYAKRKKVERKWSRLPREQAINACPIPVSPYFESVEWKRRFTIARKGLNWLPSAMGNHSFAKTFFLKKTFWNSSKYNWKRGWL